MLTSTALLPNLRDIANGSNQYKVYLLSQWSSVYGGFTVKEECILTEIKVTSLECPVLGRIKPRFLILSEDSSRDVLHRGEPSKPHVGPSRVTVPGDQSPPNEENPGWDQPRWFKKRNEKATQYYTGLSVCRFILCQCDQWIVELMFWNSLCLSGLETPLHFTLVD